MSIKFDFACIWRSMDEYIEYFFHKNAVTDHSHACCNTVNQQNKGKLVLKYNILQRQHMATSSSQALDNWSEIFYSCWYWSVKRTHAATPPSPCCAPPPPPPHTPCPTSAWPPHEGRGCSARWRHRLAVSATVAVLWTSWWLIGDVNIIVCYQVRHKWVLLIVVSPFLPRMTVKTSSKVFFPIVLAVEKL